MNDVIIGCGLIGVQCIIVLYLKNEGDGITWKEWFNTITLNKFTKQKDGE